MCQVGYYMGEDGCEPCRAAGTNCTAVGATAATLPLLADWWRFPNSTQLERCFAISNCTGGSDAHQLCGEGYEVRLPLHPLMPPHHALLSLYFLVELYSRMCSYTSLQTALTGCLLWCLFGEQQRTELPSLIGPVQAV